MTLIFGRNESHKCRYHPKYLITISVTQLFLVCVYTTFFINMCQLYSKSGGLNFVIKIISFVKVKLKCRDVRLTYFQNVFPIVQLQTTHRCLSMNKHGSCNFNSDHYNNTGNILFPCWCNRMPFMTCSYYFIGEWNNSFFFPESLSTLFSKI